LPGQVSDPQHIPVLLEEVLKVLDPQPGQTVVDCTVGLGGHAMPIAERIGREGLLVGLDADQQAVAASEERLRSFGRSVRLLNRNFSELSAVLSELGITRVDAIFADLGVSSLQLDKADRGFSFQQDGPLDMRMDQRLSVRAADLVNSLKEQQLSDLLYTYGQEGKSRKIAQLICQKRRSRRIDSTAELAGIVCEALGIRYDPSKRRIHPATKTFQALRIAVNGELDALRRLLEQAPKLLKAGGRIALISFHSLEDAAVKDDFRQKAKEGLYFILTKKPLAPTATEILRNPRSRSAKLRGAQRTDLA